MSASNPSTIPTPPPTSPTAPHTRLGLQIPNFTYPGVDAVDLFDAVASIAITAEESGFDTVFVMDHFFQLPMLGPPELEMFECYTLLGALAARTSSIRLSALVTGVTYRHPAVLAKQVTTLDVVSRGRAMLGIGAAWFELEHDALGIEFPPLKVRYEHLVDALRISRAMFTERRSSVTGTHHRTVDAWNSPRPIRPGGPPIMVGGSGEQRTFRIAAEHADELNMNCGFDEIPRKLSALHGHLDDLGRDREAVRTSCLGSLVIARTDAEARERLGAMLRQRGVDDPAAILDDPDVAAGALPRVVWGGPDRVRARVDELLATGLDGVVFNMPADGHDLEQVRLAGDTLRPDDGVERGRSASAAAAPTTYDARMTADTHAGTPSVAFDDIDLSDIEFWLADRTYRNEAFRTLRDTPGLAFYTERVIEGYPFPPGPGYYAVTRHEDVWTVSRNAQLFCSGQGSNIGDLPQEMNEFFGSMINMDDPKHFRLRSIVSKGFTPKEVARVEEFVKTKATSIIDRILTEFPEGHCDFVEHIAAALPLEVICDMMGIPPEDYGKVFHWTNVILGAGDPDFGGSYEALMASAIEMFQYAQELGESRRAHPTDDITSIMMNAEVDGEQLTPQEFGSFFILLVVAGNETTRNAISHGMKALTDFPDQRARWFDDFEAHTRTAVEEIVRWSSPVIHFRRTVTADTVVGGQELHPGDKVVMFYGSANRDERVFENPDVFDVARPLQPAQVGFGAGGPHFCLGANLARREIAVMFDEIRRRVPDLRITGEPDYLQSNFINGIKRLECAWG